MSAVVSRVRAEEIKTMHSLEKEKERIQEETKRARKIDQCKKLYKILRNDFKADVTLNEVRRAFKIFIHRMQGRMVIGGDYKVPLREAIAAAKYLQNGFSDKIELILFIFLLEIRRKREEVYLLGLGFISVIRENKNLWIYVDVDLETFLC